MLFAIAGCAEKNIPNPTTNCESAYEFKYTTSDDLPVACYTVNSKECCSWELRSGTHMEMCLDESCLWQVKDLRPLPGSRVLLAAP